MVYPSHLDPKVKLSQYGHKSSQIYVGSGLFKPMLR